MGSPSPAPTKLKKDSPTTRAGPHVRTSSVTSSCVSLDSGDQDAHSPARSTGPGKSPITRSTSSPRTPAGVNPGEKSVSPAAMKKRRSSIGGTEDLVRGLDFSTSSSPVNEEKKLHSFLAKGGGHKKVAPPVSITAQASSPGKKTGTTPPGKEKLVAGRATSTSVLSSRKLSDGREISKKDISSPQKTILALEGSSMNGITSANSEMRKTAEQVARKKSSPLRGSVDGKIGKSSPRPNTKSKSEVVFTKGRTISNDDQLAATVSSIDQAETKTDFKFSSGVSLDGKIGKKSSPTPSLKSRSSLTSSTGRKLTKSRQETPSPPQLGRVKTQVDKAARSGELSRPEMESVEVPVYADYEYERETKFENVVNMSHKMSASLQHREADEETSALLASLMVRGNMGDDDMSSLEQGVEPGFDNDMDLPTSWLSEDLPCMFSSLSHLPEPDDSSSSLLGDPPEVLDEPFQRSSNGNLLASPNDTIVAEEASNVVVSSPQSPPLIMDEKIVIVDYPTGVLNGVHQHPADESAWNYETSSFSHTVGDPVDKFEAELRTQTEAADEPESPQRLMPQDEDPAGDFEAELRTQIDATYELESPQLSVSPAGQEYVVPVAISKPSLAVDKGRTMPFKFTSLPQDISNSTRDNEFSVTESVALEAFLQRRSTEVTENMVTVEGQSHPISSQIVGDPTERSQMVPTYLEDDEGKFHLDSPSCADHMINVSNTNPTLHEEGRCSTVEDEISTLHSSPNQLVVESSDGELLEEIIEDSDSAQLNLKQSFDDVAEPFAVSRSRVNEIDSSHPNTVNTVSVDMVVPREDICTENALEQYTNGPPKLALSPESEFAAEFLDEQDREAFTPTNLDQDMKIFEEYWTQTVADESSQSDAGQNDAEDLQPSTLSETQLLNTIEDEAVKSLPPIELPVSILPVVGKLKFTVEEPVNLEPPGQLSPEVGATKLHVVDVIEEILPREGLPSPDSTESLPASDDYQIEVESSNKGEVEEFDEVFHLFGGSEDLNTSVFLFDNLSSPSRPNTLPDDHIQDPLGPNLSESFEETTFKNAGESDSNDRLSFTASMLTTKPPYVVDTARVVLDVQNRDVERVTEHQDFSIKKFAAQDASVDELLHDPHYTASRSGALDGPADQEPIHEDLGTPPLLAVNSNGHGVNIQHLDDDEFSDESVTSEGLDFSIEDPHLSLSTAIQNDFHKTSFETPAMSKSHVMTVRSNEVSEFAQENPSMLQRVEYYGNNLQNAEGDGDRTADLTDNGKSSIRNDSILKINNSQSSPNRDLSGLIVQVPAETADPHDLDSEVLPKLHLVEGDQTFLVSPQSNTSAGAATEEVDLSESNAPFLRPVGGIKDEEQTKANFLSDLDKGEESPYAAVHIEGHVDGAASHGERQERIEDDSFQIHGDDDFQDGERLSAPAIKIDVESQRDVDISEVEHEPQILQLISSEVLETSEDCSTEDESRDCVAKAAVDKSLPVGVLDERSSTQALSVACSPMFNEEDDVITDKFDSKSEVNSTASLDMVIPGTEATIDYNDTASTTEVLGKDEEIHIVAEPMELSAGESTFTNASPSVVADERRETTEDLEIDQDKSEEASKIISTSVPTLSELIQHHNHNLQKTHLPLGTLASTDDQVSPTETAPEREKALVTVSDAGFDEDRSEAAFEDHVIEGVEIIPENCSSQELALKLFVTSSQVNPNAEISDFDDVKEDPDFSWKVDKLEGESLNGILERSTLPKDVVTVVDSPEKPFIVSDQDAEINVDVDEREEESSFSRKTERENAFLNGSLEAEPSSEDEETVVFSPKNSYVTASSSDTEILDTSNIGNHSSISWMGDKAEESSNGSVEEKSLLEDVETVVYSNNDTSGATRLGMIDIQDHSTASWKAESEKDYLNKNLENTFLKDDGMAVDSLKPSFVISGQDITTLDDSEMEEQSNTSWTTDKKDQGLNGSLEGGSMLEDEKMVVTRFRVPFNDSVHGTPGTEISGVNIQNPSNISWTADKDELESSSRSLHSEESLQEDEDTVVYRPMESLVPSGQDLPDTTRLDDDEMEGHLKFSEKADMNEKSSNGIVMEETMPKVEESMPEVQESVEENHVEALVVHNNTNEEALIVDDVEKHPTWSNDKEDEESLNGNIMARESMVEVQEMVENPVKPIVVPNLLDTSAESLDGVDETEKHPSWKIQEEEAASIRSLDMDMFEVEEKVVGTPKESSVVSDQEDNTNLGISDVGELEKDSTWTTDKEGERLNRSLEEDSVLEIQETVMDTSSSQNVKDMLVCETVPEVNGAMCESKNSNTDSIPDEDLVCHSQIEDGAMIPHESNGDTVHISMDAIRLENSSHVNTDHSINEDSDLGKSNRSAAVVDCEIPEKTNGNDLHESECPQETSTSTETSVLAVKTGASNLESNPEDIDSLEEATEPESPEATLYPLLASQPPFSGSQQDRLWEEQAEAYSSGGRGTPARNEDATQAAAPSHPPSSPGEPPISSDDQIQPASGPMNNGLAIAGPSHIAGENGNAQHEPKGKGKLHTPLRSLLLEDANKGTDGDSSAPNAVTSSPSFIRRLFRVMSTPSRSAERADVSHPKLKKSSSMWINCLGSPQVQQ